MTVNDNHHKFHYIELPSTDNTAMKAFYGAVFGWTFQDYGPSYTAIHGAGIEGGFDGNSDNKPTTDGALVIIYSEDLDSSQKAVETAGGAIITPIFDFPGGRRFHFEDPSGNGLAVWTTVKDDA